MKSTESLIERDAVQLELIPSSEMPDSLFSVAEKNPRNPEFTAVRFFNKYPEKYEQIVSLRAEGLSIKRLCQMFKVSEHTVAAVEKREMKTGNVAMLKQSASMSYRYLAKLGADRLQEILLDPDVKLQPQQLAVMIGVLEDKAALLSGDPTHRIDTSGELSHDKVLNILQRLKDEAKRMGFDGEKSSGQKGESVGDGAIDVDCVDVSDAGVSGDAADAVPNDVAPDKLSDVSNT